MFAILRIVHYLGEGGEKRRTPLIHRPRQLRMLAKSKDAGMRFAVARSSYTPTEVLELLSHDQSWTVRMAVSWHEKLTLPILERLLSDPEKPVREGALRSTLFQRLCEKEWHSPLPELVLESESSCAA
jgi:HEAT repeat protein